MVVGWSHDDCMMHTLSQLGANITDYTDTKIVIPVQNATSEIYEATLVSLISELSWHICMYDKSQHCIQILSNEKGKGREISEKTIMKISHSYFFRSQISNGKAHKNSCGNIPKTSFIT